MVVWVTSPSKAEGELEHLELHQKRQLERAKHELDVITIQYQNNASSQTINRSHTFEGGPEGFSCVNSFVPPQKQ